MSKHSFWKYRNFLVLIFFSFTTTVSFGQGQYNNTSWKFSNPTPFGFTVIDVDYFDNNNAIAVGSDGGIAKSTDGGNTWTYGVFTYTGPTGLTQKTSLNDVHFISANVAYAVGNNGCMAKTTDGGDTWSFVATPLFANNKIIYTCWFLNDNKGYIGGEVNNSADSIPKLYVTLDGGSTWDSIAPPAVNGVSRVGYINNPNIPSVLWPVDARLKTIQRIEFINDSTGYICGSSSGGVTFFPPVSLRAANATTCLPLTTFLTSGSFSASLLWKFKSGVLTNYSLSKERLGYTGVNTSTITCTTTYGTLTPITQTYRAMNIINDSTVVMMSFNNNAVVKVHTGKNDSTLNINATGVYEKGKYEVLNFPFPPNGGTPIPPVQVLLASNPYQIKRAASGKLFATGNFGRMFTSVDTGRNWVREASLPQGQNYSNNGTWALDIAPNGKFLSMGTNGVVADSVPGSVWKSNYISTPLSAGYNNIQFADCNNGMAAGGASITVTADGGKTWIDKYRADFASSFYSINGTVFPNLANAYFAVSNGTIYHSPDQGTTLDPIFANFTYQMFDVAAQGSNIWAIGYAQSLPSASRTSSVFRSTDGGVNWSTYSGFPVGTLSQNLKEIEFPTALIGYAAGNRDTIYKTTDGGATWNKLPLPFPGVTPQITYTDMYALDANTVFLTGNGFPRKVVIKTTDGGATWTDITGNILSFGGPNLNSILMHDANNGYVVSPGGTLFKTNNGGANWMMDLAPTNCIFTCMAFAPINVPAGISMANRKLFVSGVNVSGAPMMEYGSPADINVNSTEVVTGGCLAGAAGSIVVNATGGIAPYTYSIDGGAFQTSNTFSNLTSGTKTITINDAFCGSLTKTVVVDVKQSPAVNAGPDKTIVDGDVVMLSGNGVSSPVSIAWTPTGSIISGGNTYTATVKPTATTTYTLAVTAANGCVSTDDAVVTVIPYCVKVMNAFTPNGDGFNDRWLVTNGASCSQQIIAKVFNRYGELVYSNDNYNNDWDGKYKGKPVADGTYYYVLQFRLINGNSIPVKGDVTILR